MQKVLEPGMFFKVMLGPVLLSVYAVAIDPSQWLPSIGNLVYLGVLAIAIAAVMRRDVADLIKWRQSITQELRDYFKEHAKSHELLTGVCSEMKTFNRIAERRLEMLEDKDSPHRHRRHGDE